MRPWFFGKPGGASAASGRGQNETNCAGRTSNSRSRLLTKTRQLPAGKSRLPIWSANWRPTAKTPLTPAAPLDGSAQKDQEAVPSAPQKEQTQTRWSKGTPRQTPSPGAARQVDKPWLRGHGHYQHCGSDLPKPRRSELPNRGRRAAPSSDGTAAAAHITEYDVRWSAPAARMARVRRCPRRPRATMDIG